MSRRSVVSKNWWLSIGIAKVMLQNEVRTWFGSWQFDRLGNFKVAPGFGGVKVQGGGGMLKHSW